jgi:hypothetical protein
MHTSQAADDAKNPAGTAGVGGISHTDSFFAMRKRGCCAAKKFFIMKENFSLYGIKNLSCCFSMNKKMSCIRHKSLQGSYIRLKLESNGSEMSSGPRAAAHGFFSTFRRASCHPPSTNN